jgi:hypothetical protein
MRSSANEQDNGIDTAADNEYTGWHLHPLALRCRRGVSVRVVAAPGVARGVAGCGAVAATVPPMGIGDRAPRLWTVCGVSALADSSFWNLCGYILQQLRSVLSCPMVSEYESYAGRAIEKMSLSPRERRPLLSKSGRCSRAVQYGCPGAGPEATSWCCLATQQSLSL